jgi:NADPH:quinone reductase
VRTVQVCEFGVPEVLRMTEVDASAAGPGQVTVDVSIVPVLFLDTQLRSGAARDWFPARPPYAPGAGWPEK